MSIDLATASLRTAAACLADAAYHLEQTALEDSALLAQHCDKAEADVRAVLSAVQPQARNP